MPSLFNDNAIIATSFRAPEATTSLEAIDLSFDIYKEVHEIQFIIWLSVFLLQTQTPSGYLFIFGHRHLRGLFFVIIGMKAAFINI